MAKCMVDAESHCKLYPRCYGCNAFRNPTNADRIRSMSDEELAMCLYEIGYDEGWDKPEYALKWLHQPAEENNYEAVGTKEIDKAPTIDAVPVVRCKDCKYFKTRLCENEDNHDDWFCADGERKGEVSK